MNFDSSKRVKALFVVLLLLIVTLAFLVAGPINSLLDMIMGERLQENFGTPILEEILKSLSILIPFTVYLENDKLEFMEYLEVDYMIGYLLGGLFGVFENYFVYHFFTGFRAATPLLHAFGTGIVGIGYYSVITGGRDKVRNLIIAYIVAISLHSLWNNLATLRYILPLGVMAISMTFAGLGFFIICFYRYQSDREGFGLFGSPSE